MQRHTIDVFMGFGGVHPAENERAVRWGGYLEAPMLVIALWILLDWYLITHNMLDPELRSISDWVVWGFFLLETLILTTVTTDRVRHLSRNWANLAIIILAFPPLFEVNEQFGILRQNHLGKTLVVSAMFITGAGILIAGIDPSIGTPAEGIWWAWVTVTTVGYGDVVPTSTAGRIFASLLILMGICLVSLITANVSAYLLARSAQRELRYEQRELRKLLEMEERMSSLEKKIDTILDTLQKKKN